MTGFPFFTQELMTMRIFSQSNNIPESFKGVDVPAPIKNIMNDLNQKFSLSMDEIDFLLDALDDLTKWKTQRNLMINDSRFSSQLATILSWARETGNSILGKNLPVVYMLAHSYEVNAKVNKAFSQKPSIIKQIKLLDNSRQMGYIQLDEMLENGLSEDEFLYVFKKSNPDRITASIYRNRCANVIKWARATSTNLNNIPSMDKAAELQQEWADYQRRLALSKRLSKRGLKTVNLSGKWKAVWIDPTAIAKPLPEPENLTVIRQDGGPQRTEEIYLEQDITGISLNYSNNIISVRDENGVPMASIVVGDETNDKIEIYDIDGKQQGIVKVKELLQKLEKAGKKLLWIGDPVEIAGVRDLIDFVKVNNMGIIPSISVDHSLVDNANSYKAALDMIFSDSFNRDFFLKTTAQLGINALSDYAEQRNELYELESGREMFSSDAMDNFIENLGFLDDIPRSPDESDEEFNQNGIFDEEAFKASQRAYDQAVEAAEAEWAPYQFDTYVYHAVQSRRNKPENKDFYDAIDKKREEEARKRQEELQEQARQKEFNETQQKAEKALSLMNPQLQDFEIVHDEPEDLLEIFAFDIAWKKQIRG